jgi:hypothetical protein
MEYEIVLEQKDDLIIAVLTTYVYGFVRGKERVETEDESEVYNQVSKWQEEYRNEIRYIRDDKKILSKVFAPSLDRRIEEYLN